MPSRPLHVRQAKDSASVDRALVAAALASVAAASFIAQPWTKSDMEAVQGPGGSGGSDDNSKVKDKLLPMSEVMSQIQDRLKQFRTERFLAPSHRGPGRSGGEGSRRTRDPLQAATSFPKIAVLTKGRSAEEPFTIEVPLPARGGSEARVLAASLQALQKKGHTITFHTGLASDQGTSLSFVLADQSGSLLLTSSPAASVPSEAPQAVLPARPGTSRLLLFKKEGFTEGDVDAVVESYISAWSGNAGDPIAGNFASILDAFRAGGTAGVQQFLDSEQDTPLPFFPPSTRGALDRPGVVMGGNQETDTAGRNDPVARLRKLGAEVFEKGKGEEVDWSCLAGYEGVKAEVEDTVVMALQHAEVYEAIARQTRERYESNRPRAVLFEGPPGTGKTLTARIVASRTEVPLVFVPTERVLSKWYGDSEKNLAKIFEACQELGGAIIFIDEVDALATSRDSNMHEATRRLLSVILQSIEGFKGGSQNVLICATNRRQDLDSALLSRFDVSIKFELPALGARQAIFARYAKHLKAEELARLAEASEGFSCRDIKETCENVERKWASKTLRGQERGPTPVLQEYLQQLKAMHLAHRRSPQSHNL